MAARSEVTRRRCEGRRGQGDWPTRAVHSSSTPPGTVRPASDHRRASSSKIGSSGRHRTVSSPAAMARHGIVIAVTRLQRPPCPPGHPVAGCGHPNECRARAAEAGLPPTPSGTPSGPRTRPATAVGPGTLLLADRNFLGTRLWAAFTDAGTHLLWRVKTHVARRERWEEGLVHVREHPPPSREDAGKVPSAASAAHSSSP